MGWALRVRHYENRAAETVCDYPLGSAASQDLIMSSSAALEGYLAPLERKTGVPVLCMELVSGYRSLLVSNSPDHEADGHSVGNAPIRGLKRNALEAPFWELDSPGRTVGVSGLCAQTGQTAF